ncbi:hypothetical protein [Streptomyces sp. NPDC097610]|uniref:hypothetical protein n=1 Tax=Streptomyces sp. NPDC097610 TaxID=3157227 RepID=UPI00332B00A0
MPTPTDHTAGLPVYGDGRPPLTTRDLMSMLRGQPNRLIVLSADSEGNQYSPLYGVGVGMFDARQLTGELYPTPQQMKEDPTLARLFGPLPDGLREVFALTPAD